MFDENVLRAIKCNFVICANQNYVQIDECQIDVGGFFTSSTENGKS